MARRPAPPMFVARAAYRQRRLRDIARAVPVAGCVLWFLPLLWAQDRTDTAVAGSGIIYIFGIWVLLIILTAIVARFITLEDAAPNDDVAR